MSHIIKESANGYQILESRDLLMTNRKVFLTSEVTRESSAGIIEIGRASCRERV